jgi:16S rRNA (cytosine967-C5)-methyltransferase
VEPARFLAMLEQQGIAYTVSTYIDYFVRVKSLSRIGQMDLFRSGLFTIQDESAALPALLLAPEPGERVLDLCAAPGGKATHIAELMKNKGQVIAVDKYEAKLALIKGACERLGLKNVELLAADARTLENMTVDKVLLDAPCSGLGVLAKKPDIKWKRDFADIVKLSRMQSEMLDDAVRFIRPGGVIVYSTCSIEPEENQGVVTSFLYRQPEFHLDPAGKYVNQALVSPEGFVETYPHRHGMDGSFAARLVRSAEAGEQPSSGERS